MADVTTTARLRALVELADTGSVRAAATRLFVTEASVSAAVTALARDVGVTAGGKERTRDPHDRIWPGLRAVRENHPWLA